MLARARASASRRFSSAASIRSPSNRPSWRRRSSSGITDVSRSGGLRPRRMEFPPWHGEPGCLELPLLGEEVGSWLRQQEEAALALDESEETGKQASHADGRFVDDSLALKLLLNVQKYSVEREWGPRPLIALL